ncbi:hypothetical protein VST7929_02042 [Vibrio stylophorae]|uniref:Molecular chaperone n=1 Tax=Vibrio stylophorae TaxID=659351 RepID=A0ABM8ZUZ4_9VIBR|nr:flagellar protein FlgN [Vibrio stylophorae]CAH0534141.1 hypothetical protein VST7929_02042 [Vibrio stylophorae]
MSDDSLLAILERQLSTAKALQLHLLKEREAIAKRDAKNIEHLAKEKLQFLIALEQNDKQAAAHEQVARLREDPNCQQQIDAIHAVIAQCQQDNEINGELLQNAQLTFNRLHNLFQQSRGRQTMTYNQAGQTQNIRSLGTNLKA